MPEETTTTQDVSAKLQEAVWGDAPAVATPPQPAQETKAEETSATPPAEEDEIIDVPDWLKREFEVDDVNILKQEREELKRLKNQPAPKELDDYSKKVIQSLQEGKEDELYSHLHNKRELSRLEKYAIENTKEASEIIKANLQFKHPNLKSEDIDFLYNKRYSIPSKPVHDTTNQSDEDYAAMVDQWKDAVQEKEREIIIEAKLAKPELAKYKSELAFPDIPVKQATVNEPTQEELDKFKRDKEAFLQNAETTINDFKGFSGKVQVDKDVEIPLSYGLSKEERSFISDKIKVFAESGFNTNALFVDKWVDDKNVVNVRQMTEDLSRLYFGDKVEQKFASDSAAQRLELYLKDKKNIKIEPQKGVDFAPDGDKNEVQKIQEHFWNS